jgi:hypothetical protein
VPVPASRGGASALPQGDARSDALQLAPAHDDLDAALAFAAGLDGYAAAVTRRLPLGAPEREAALHGFSVCY